MRNIVLEKREYISLRAILREKGITYLDKGDIIYIPSWQETVLREGSDVNGKSPGSIARELIENAYPSLNLRWRREEKDLLKLEPPHFFEQDTRGELSWLDLSNAYYTIYNSLWLHGEYYCPPKLLKFPLSRIPLFDQPKPVKVSIVGIVRGCKSKWVKGARVWYTDIYNPYLSPFLWAVISNVLHEIAQRALLLGAIHVNTDGYIFKSFKAFCSMRDFIEDNELPYKSGIGDGVVTGLNSYYISSVPTVKATEELTKSRPKNNIIVPKRSDFNWLDYWQSTRKKENE